MALQGVARRGCGASAGAAPADVSDAGGAVREGAVVETAVGGVPAPAQEVLGRAAVGAGVCLRDGGRGGRADGAGVHRGPEVGRGRGEGQDHHTGIALSWLQPGVSQAALAATSTFSRNPKPSTLSRWSFTSGAPLRVAVHVLATGLRGFHQCYTKAVMSCLSNSETSVFGEKQARGCGEREQPIDYLRSGSCGQPNHPLPLIATSAVAGNAENHIANKLRIPACREVLRAGGEESTMSSRGEVIRLPPPPDHRRTPGLEHRMSDF